MDTYTIAEDSEIPRATIDKKKLVVGGDPVDLTKDQHKRLVDMGVKLTTKAPPSNSNS